MEVQKHDQDRDREHARGIRIKLSLDGGIMSAGGQCIWVLYRKSSKK
jgi:hypothetical protein